MTALHDATSKRFEDAQVASEETCWELTLFVSGVSAPSARAIANARRLCDTHLDGRYRLSFVDVHEDHAAVVRSQVLAVPTLIKRWPLPVQTLVGDLSETDKVLRALGLPAAEPSPPRPS